jgi:hypothetical protein
VKEIARPREREAPKVSDIGSKPQFSLLLARKECPIFRSSPEKTALGSLISVIKILAPAGGGGEMKNPDRAFRKRLDIIILQKIETGMGTTTVTILYTQWQFDP